jgi:hypothetical protein
VAVMLCDSDRRCHHAVGAMRLVFSRSTVPLLPSCFAPRWRTLPALRVASFLQASAAAGTGSQSKPKAIVLVRLSVLSPIAVP